MGGRQELAELQRSCAAERMELQTVREEVLQLRKQRLVMKEKLERCRGAITHAVGSLDYLYDACATQEAEGGQEGHIMELDRDVRCAGEMVSHILETLEVDTLEVEPQCL